MSSLVQEEGRFISENVAWGHRKRFVDSKVSFAYRWILGLDKGADDMSEFIRKRDKLQEELTVIVEMTQNIVAENARAA